MRWSWIWEISAGVNPISSEPTAPSRSGRGIKLFGIPPLRNALDHLLALLRVVLRELLGLALLCCWYWSAVCCIACWNEAALRFWKLTVENRPPDRVFRLELVPVDALVVVCSNSSMS